MTPKKKLSDIVKDMSALKKQWASTRAAPDTDKPVPAGEYVAELVAGTADVSRNNNPLYKVTLKIRDGEHAGRFVWHDFYLSEKALPYTLRALGKIGITDPEQLDRPLPAGLVVRAKVVVRKRDDGTESNEVRSWELIAVSPGQVRPTVDQPANEPNPWDVDLNALDGPTPEGGAQ